MLGSGIAHAFLGTLLKKGSSMGAAQYIPITEAF